MNDWMDDSLSEKNSDGELNTQVLVSLSIWIHLSPWGDCVYVCMLDSVCVWVCVFLFVCGRPFCHCGVYLDVFVVRYSLKKADSEHKYRRTVPVDVYHVIMTSFSTSVSFLGSVGLWLCDSGCVDCVSLFRKKRCGKGFLRKMGEIWYTVSRSFF